MLQIAPQNYNENIVFFTSIFFFFFIRLQASVALAVSFLFLNMNISNGFCSNTTLILLSLKFLYLHDDFLNDVNEDAKKRDN